MADLEPVKSLDFAVDNLGTRIRRNTRRSDREINDLVGGIDLEDNGVDELADFRERDTGLEIVRSVGRMDPTSKRFGNLDEGAVLRVRNDASRNGLADRDRVVRKQRLGDTRRLLGSGTGGVGGLLLGCVGDDDDTLVVVLGDNDELVEGLAQLEPGLDLGNGHATVVGEVRHSQERLDLRREKRQEDVLGMKSRDRARDDLRDFDTGRGDRVGGRDGSRKSSLDRGDESGRGRISVDNLDLDRLADKKGVLELADVRVAGLGDGNERSNTAVHVNKHALVKELGDNSIGDGIDLGVLERGDDGKVGLNESLFERDGETVSLGVGGKNLKEQEADRKDGGSELVSSRSDSPRQQLSKLHTHSALDS